MEHEAPELVLVAAAFCVECGLTLVATSQEGPGLVSPEVSRYAGEVPCEPARGAWSSAVDDGRARLLNAD